MKILIFSDIHGSLKSALNIENLIQKEKPEMIFILGDVLYNGPRNGVHPDYNPMEVANILNKYADKIKACNGNCDSRIDMEILKFDMPLVNKVKVDNKEYILMHGDQPLSSLFKPSKGDIILSGHTHIPKIEVHEGILYLNPGSITFPKQEDKKRTYMKIENNIVSLYAYENELLFEKNMDNLLR